MVWLLRRFVDDDYRMCSGVRRVLRNVSRESRLMRICGARVFIAAESHGRQNLRNPPLSRRSRPCRRQRSRRLNPLTRTAIRETRTVIPEIRIVIGGTGPAELSRSKPRQRKYLRERLSDPSPHRVPSEGASSAPRCLTELKSEPEVSRASSPHPPHVRNRSHARSNHGPSRSQNNHVQNRLVPSRELNSLGPSHVLKDRLSVTNDRNRLSRDRNHDLNPDQSHDQSPDRSLDPSHPEVNHLVVNRLEASHRAVNHRAVSRLVVNHHEGLSRDPILVRGDRIIFDREGYEGSILKRGSFRT